MKKNIKNRHKDFHEHLLEILQDPEEAAGYLNAALEDEDPRVFLLALRDVLEARLGGLSTAAKKSRLNRESLYRMLSEKGNPQLKSVRTLLGSMNMHLAIEADKKTGK